MAISPRSSVIVALAGVSLVLTAGCADEADGARSTIGTVMTTSYVVEDPATTPPPTTAPVSGSVPVGGQVSPVEQIYTIEAGDSISKIAGLHGITMDVLVNYNGWTDGLQHFLVVGETVKIPPNSEVPGTGSDPDTGGDADTGADTGDDADTDTQTDSSSATDPTDPAGTACQHTIVAGENPSKVADTYGITVDELRAANTGGVMDSFLVGAELNIPSNGTC